MRLLTMTPSSVSAIRGSKAVERCSPLQIAHAILKEHNLPHGLLPMESLADISFNSSDGRFVATQGKDECMAEFGGHYIKFDRVISGDLCQNGIFNLKGIRVKRFLMWLPIGSVRTDPPPGKNIHFQVGPFTASLPAKELWEYKFWAPSFNKVPESPNPSRCPPPVLHLPPLSTRFHSATALCSPRSPSVKATSSGSTVIERA
ncbi:unnamed protein product [Closterium sp. Yama58-4]|nr:unnamed protein product [Closterium sp. Yama58-4]